MKSGRSVETRIGTDWRLAERISERLGCTRRVRSLIFLWLDLTAMPTDARSEPFLRLVSAADVRRWSRYADGWFTRDKALERLQRGCQLFVLQEGGTDACYGWVERDSVQIRWIPLLFNLPADVAYLTGLYTVPEMRKRGLALRTWSAVAQRCKRVGAKYLFVVVDSENTASLRLHEKLGFHAYQRIDYRRVFFLRCYRVTAAGSRSSHRWLGFSSGPTDAWRAFCPGESPAIATGEF